MAYRNRFFGQIGWDSFVNPILAVAVVVSGITTAEAQPPATPKAAAPAKKKAVEIPIELNIDSETLPPGYFPPPERLPIYDIEGDHAILSKEDRDQLAKDNSRFAKTRNDCDTTAAGQKIVNNAIRYKLSELTLKEKLDDLPQIRRKIVDQVAVPPAGKRPDDVKAMSQLIGQTILKQIPELLSNQYIVRVQAAELLGEIDYAPAYDLLLKLIQAKNIADDEVEGQPEGVKIAAAKSLVRLLRFTNISVKDRMTVARAVTAELENPDSYRWLQVLLIENLRYCEVAGIDATNNDKPFVVDSLMSVIKDQKRPWRVRTRACYAIGRVPLPKTSVKPDDVVTAVTECALQVSNAAAAKPGDPEWKNCIWDIYLAFHRGGTAKDPDQDVEKKPGGLLEKNKAVAQKPYEAVVPIVNDIMSGKAPDAGNLRNLSEFVRNRQAKLGGLETNPVQ